MALAGRVGWKRHLKAMPNSRSVGAHRIHRCRSSSSAEAENTEEDVLFADRVMPTPHHLL